MKPILIAKVGSTVESILDRRGDFHDWLRVLLGRDEATALVCEPHLGDTLPALDEFGGVIVTGASAMITDEADWSVRTEAWLARVFEARIPILGICYGHQMLARIAGGHVDWNPNGREIGTVDVKLCGAANEDQLFQELPACLDVQTTHSQSVVELPPGAIHLASNAHDSHQAFSLGDSAWGVQFHPEFDADVLRGYLEERRESIASEGIDVDARLEATRDSDHGERLLLSFEALVRSRQ